MSNRVHLNVGGRHFETTKETLIQSPYFEALLNRWAPDSSKEIFLDRSGKAFEHVLSFLRNPKYNVPFPYQSELEFYGLQSHESSEMFQLRTRQVRGRGEWMQMELKMHKSLYSFFEKVHSGRFYAKTCHDVVLEKEHSGRFCDHVVLVIDNDLDEGYVTAGKSKLKIELNHLVACPQGIRFNDLEKADVKIIKTVLNELLTEYNICRNCHEDWSEWE